LSRQLLNIARLDSATYATSEPVAVCVKTRAIRTATDNRTRSGLGSIHRAAPSEHDAEVAGLARLRPLRMNMPRPANRRNLPRSGIGLSEKIDRLPRRLHDQPLG